MPVGQGTVVTIANRDVALFNVDGTIYAMENACLHQGQSLGSSPLNGCVVTCRAHGWRYDVTTGNTLHVPDYGVGDVSGQGRGRDDHDRAGDTASVDRMNGGRG